MPRLSARRGTETTNARLPVVEKCSGECRAAAVAKSASCYAPDTGGCLFYRHGWYDRFKSVGRAALDAYLAAHPGLKAEGASSGSRDGEILPGPFSNC